ncbi:MAG TPA: folate-binding protein, partial [Rhodospirillaceae bacterium]|nr:folate-binding protein [Rhodospirillaceae bacterium]
MAFYTFLPHRGLMTVKGIDRFNFLQGLISNDMRKVEAGEVVWAALLSPQGKFLHDFFIFSMKDVIYLDCEYDRRDDLLALLLRYKLRAKVTLDTKCILETGVAWGNSVDVALRLPRITNAPSAIQGGFIYRDPRLPAAGLRWALPKDTAKKTLGESGLIASEPQIFDLHRFSLGLPDGSRDMEIEKALLLENGFEELHGIDFQKGCYMGQELTARTHYRALIKKR